MPAKPKVTSKYSTATIGKTVDDAMVAIGRALGMSNAKVWIWN
jgi:hypothetical protein